MKQREMVISAAGTAAIWIISTFILASLGFPPLVLAILPTAAAIGFLFLLGVMYNKRISVLQLPPEARFEKKDELCIIIAAPSHGVLQDRVNHWLAGKYGEVRSSSMAVNEKGYFMTIFYQVVIESGRKLTSDQGE